MKKGQFLSETTFYVVDEITSSHILATTNTGQLVKLGLDYVKGICNNASEFTKEMSVTQTELIGHIISNARVAMSIYYQKVDKVKAKKTYSQELEDRTEQLAKDFMAKGKSALKDALTNPVLDFIPGEMRLIIGYPTGSYADNGLINFIDSEEKYLIKQVNPRTIEYVIVNSIKYIKK